MTYANDSFWQQYHEYVDETHVRHARVCRQLGAIKHKDYILDLGCGKVMEGQRLPLWSWARGPDAYRGVDVNPREGSENQVFCADYRTQLPEIKAWCDRNAFEPDCIISLFSIEPTGSWRDNLKLYCDLFATFPLVRDILSLGFYYEGREHLERIEEAGGLVSYQSTGPLVAVEDLRETRVLERGP